MENYTISKESVLALAATSQTARLILTENFPDAFKKEMEVGRWYKGTKRNFLLNYQGDNMENYGFWEDKGFRNNLYFGSYWSNECIEATPKEVETALIAEAKKRGFVEGAKFKSFERGNLVRTIGKFQHYGIFDYSDRYNSLNVSTIKSEWENYNSNQRIFDNGKWASIIHEEIKEITMDKAVKILSKKYGKKVIIKYF